MRIAQFGDEHVDGVSGYGVQSGRRRIVKHNQGIADDGAGHRNAATHPSRKLSRHLVDGVLQFDKPEDLAHPAFDLFFGSLPLLPQSVGNVFVDRKRIEQRPLLEHNPHAPAHQGKLIFGKRDEVLTLNQDSTGVGLEQAQEKFQEDRFAGPRYAQQDERLTSAHLKGDVEEHQLVFKGDADVRDFDGRFVRPCGPGRWAETQSH